MRLVIACCILAVIAAVVCAPVGAEDLASRLAQVTPAHPRVFFTDAAIPELKARIEGDPLLAGVYTQLLASADAALAEEPLKREKIGKRLLHVSRACLQRVSYLAFAYRMTRNDAYLKRAEREMLAVAAFEDWNPSHFLDVAEMSAALGIGYDWLYNELPAESRAIIRDALIKKGLEASFPGGGWVTSNHNWNQVCHGGLTVGALAVLEDAPELAEKIIARGIENVPLAMHEYEPGGVYPEGPSYWQYGTTFNVLMLSALESVLGTDFGLASASGFMKTPEFYLHATGPTGLYYNYSDCGTRGGIAPAMHWLAHRRNDPGLLWIEKERLAEFVAKPGAGGDRLLPFLLLWARPMGQLEPPKTLHWKGDGRTPVAMMRSAWRPDATYVAVKGGSPSTNHAHMDTGSFVIDMKGVRWAIDLGMQSYNELETRGVDLWNRKQDSQRWTVFRIGNASHNTLVVDNQLQRVDGHGAIPRFSDDAARPYALIDLAPVYEGQLKRATRGVRLIGESVLVQDELAALDRETTVRWAMATQAAVALAGNTATLTQDGQSVSLRVIAPADAALAVVDIEKPPHDYDAQNPNTRMVVFETRLAPSSNATLAVMIEPGAPADVAVEPLEKW